MGSATREALAAARGAVEAVDTADLRLADDLLSAGRLIGESAPLRSALTDAEADPAQKRALIEAIFGAKISAAAVSLLVGLASTRWSAASDLLEGIEEAGIRLAVRSAAGADIAGELFAFERIVAHDAGLELALGSKLSPTRSKVALVDRLLDGTAAPQTALIVRHLVQQPRGRRVGELLRDAARIAADELGYRVAIVTSAVPLSTAQLHRLESSLAAQYERPVRINSIVDRAVVGGVRVQIGDDVIDGSVASRLGALRQQLAG